MPYLEDKRPLDAFLKQIKSFQSQHIFARQPPFQIQEEEMDS